METDILVRKYFISLHTLIFSESPNATRAKMVFGVETRRKLFSGEDDFIDDLESPIKFSASPDDDSLQTPSFVEAYGDDDKDRRKTSSVEKSLVRKRRGIE